MQKNETLLSLNLGLTREEFWFVDHCEKKQRFVTEDEILSTQQHLMYTRKGIEW
jgi:hypothetical protein